MNKLLVDNLKGSQFNIVSSNLLINLHTRAVIELPEGREYRQHLMEFLKSPHLFKTNSKFKEDDISNFKEFGFLIDKEQDEFEQLKNGFIASSSMQMLQSIKDKVIRPYYEFVITPTYSCNLSCAYCFQKEKHLVFDEAKVQAVIKFFDNLISIFPLNGANNSEASSSEAPLINLSFFGGEAMLRYRDIRRIVLSLKEKQKTHLFNFSCSITSNGILYSEEIVNEMINDLHFRKFQFTIDGNEEQHNKTRYLKKESSFKRILATTELIIKRKQELDKSVHVCLRFNLLNHTLSDIEEALLEYPSSIRGSLTVLFRNIYSPADFKVCKRNPLLPFYKLAKSLGYEVFDAFDQNYSFCESQSGITINPNLYLWKCDHDLDYEKFKIGEISLNGDLLLDEQKVKECEALGFYHDADCKKCEYAPICYGSCEFKFATSENRKRNCFKELHSDHREFVLEFFAPSLLVGDCNESTI